jgi:UDP-N-acetylmuramyl pentapeptide phosphotransferase/UDP-N-acetylglucosamine-1-phosphate transferase
MEATALSASLVLGAIGAWFISVFAGVLRLVDVPNERSSHRAVTPKGGGVGIAGGFLVASVMAGLSAHMWLPLLVMAGLALLGDWIELSPKVRLPAQLFLGGLMVIGIGQVSPPGMLSVSLGLFWVVFIVGTANFYNFMDGINGIAGLTGGVGFGLLGLYLELAGAEASAIIVAEAVALACLGFLPFNMPKARVFMGDVGSILLGAAFAGLIYMESRTVLDFLCMVSFLFPFYADELTTMVVRLRDGENLTQPHRRHIYQLLANQKGIPHWQISVGYSLAQVLVGASIIALRSLGSTIVFTALVVYFAGFAFCGFLIRSSVEGGQEI